MVHQTWNGYMPYRYGKPYKYPYWLPYCRSCRSCDYDPWDNKYKRYNQESGYYDDNVHGPQRMYDRKHQFYRRPLKNMDRQYQSENVPRESKTNQLCKPCQPCKPCSPCQPCQSYCTHDSEYPYKRPFLYYRKPYKSFDKFHKMPVKRSPYYSN